jgi:hypothetical protein
MCLISATDFTNNAVIVLYDEDSGQMSGSTGTTINPSGGIGTTSSIKYKKNIKRKETKYNDYYNRLINDFNIYTFTYLQYDNVLKNLTYESFRENYIKNKTNHNDTSINTEELKKINEVDIKKLYDKKINRIKHKNNNYHYGVIYEEIEKLYKNLTCRRRFIDSFQCPTNDPDNCEYCNGKKDDPSINLTNINYYIILALKDMNETIIKPLQQENINLKQKLNDIETKLINIENLLKSNFTKNT